MCQINKNSFHQHNIIAADIYIFTCSGSHKVICTRRLEYKLRARVAGWRGFIPAEARGSPGLLAAGAGVRPLYGGETGGSPVNSVGGSH